MVLSSLLYAECCHVCSARVLSAYRVLYQRHRHEHGQSGVLSVVGVILVVVVVVVVVSLSSSLYADCGHVRTTRVLSACIVLYD